MPLIYKSYDQALWFINHKWLEKNRTLPSVELTLSPLMVSIIIILCHIQAQWYFNVLTMHWLDMYIIIYSEASGWGWWWWWWRYPKTSSSKRLIIMNNSTVTADVLLLAIMVYIRTSNAKHQWASKQCHFLHGN